MASYYQNQRINANHMSDTEGRMNPVNSNDLKNLISIFSKRTYKPRDEDPEAEAIMQKCVDLVQVDYNLLLINNTSGELSGHYPSKILVMEYEKNKNAQMPSTSSQRQTNTIYENILDAPKLRELIAKARTARCRARFPVPVILYKGKYICRSATLSGGYEIYGRCGYEYLFSSVGYINDGSDTEAVNPNDWQLFSIVRNSDKKLLRALNVGTIIDFMVEKKKVKFGMNISSSEKVDKENRYNDFMLMSLPYPGCEFFKDYREHNYQGNTIVFNWKQSYVDASIFIPDDGLASQLNIDWSKYTEWDLDLMTTNYLRLLLKYLQDGNSGLLVHCISGWDRTPLFISLIRLSLWADGLIHQNLDASQILYFTIAYDWMLFGHHLGDRLNKGEEIFFFCFNFLKRLAEDEFSLQSPTKVRPKVERSVEKTATRTDSETSLEPIMLEQDSRGSNISLNSICSSVSTKSQEFPMMFGQTPEEASMLSGNGNSNGNLSDQCTSNAKSRTSPVTVPTRQRNDSTSSLSVGSWQVITGTGSIRESNGFSGLNANERDSNNLDEEFGFRKKRLLNVRELFLAAYHAQIGFNYHLNDTTFSSLIGGFAEKVGFTVRS
ncbi:PREDICTED: myotubularin-related protein 14 [Nicrophorus vespilloides]|uniref:Myotubularin-related protein 14 n=1 Tax=Nicrophorus vespilloides TaxID=110193 RepID=A0ABM1MAB6_NICVS|nr:PREDICTED: myotubularin-related protein 14 [Nicrophorus vespilloides]